MNAKPARSTIKPATLRKLGLVMTAMWLGLILYLADRSSGAGFALQDLAHFIVLGVTPPAILWLIWAVFRQSRALRMIKGQMHLQIDELQRLVVQQKRVVEDLRVQRAKELQASTPLLHIRAIGVGGAVEGHNIVHFVLINHGKTCTDLMLSFDNQHAPQKFGRLSDGGELPFNLALPTGSIEPVKVTASYLDQQLRRGTKRFTITGEDSAFQVHDVDGANSG